MSQKRILIAEDDPNFGTMLKSYLSVNNYDVTLCDDGNKAFAEIRKYDFDLCIFDVMMPFKDGFSLAASVTEINKDVPFIFLTAKSLKEDQVKGYKLGAIDYLVKPFDPEILLLKVQAILNQSRAQAKEIPQQFEIGQFAFDASRRNLHIQNEDIKLSPKESQLLHLLALNMNQVLRREEALHKIWQEDSFFTTKSMDVYITKLRKYLRKDNVYNIEITNLHSKGFVLSVKEK